MNQRGGKLCIISFSGGASTIARRYQSEWSLMKSTLLASELRKVSCSERLPLRIFWPLTIFDVLGLGRFIDRFLSSTTTPINLIVLARNCYRGWVLRWPSWWAPGASRWVTRLSYQRLDAALTGPKQFHRMFWLSGLRRILDRFINSTTTTPNNLYQPWALS